MDSQFRVGGRVSQWQSACPSLCHGILLWRSALHINLTPTAHISIMLLRPIKQGAKCTAKTSNKQHNQSKGQTSLYFQYHKHKFNAEVQYLVFENLIIVQYDVQLVKGRVSTLPVFMLNIDNGKWTLKSDLSVMWRTYQLTYVVTLYGIAKLSRYLCM